MKTKINCITPTLNVLPKLKVAIDCYLNQTYENKEILILFYDHDTETKDYLLGLDKTWREENNIRLFHHKGNDSIKIGAVRNYLISQVTGEYTAIWDSDDYHGERRLEKQLKHINKHKSNSCTLSNVLVYSYKHKEMRKSANRLFDGWEGTMICKTDLIPLYENIKTNSDTPILRFLSENGHNKVLKNSNLYVYTIHNNTNVSTQNHLDELFKGCIKIKKDTSHLTKIFE